MIRSLVFVGLIIFSAPAHADTLDEIMGRGFIQCGVDENAPGFAQQNDKKEWIGINTDFCRALAAALFGDGARVKFFPLTVDESAATLSSGDVDVLLHTAPWTMSRDTSLGLKFVDVLVFDDSEKPPHLIGPVVRQGDDAWFNVVRWVRAALINSEMLGITKASTEKTTDISAIKKVLGQQTGADGNSFGQALGLPDAWARNAIAAVGNYGEIFERNLGEGSALKKPRGANKLAADGGLIFAAPIQ
jgi:Bacterial extracellular solute-binding proteins, family 3